jgi:hypothetical protein
MWQERTDPARQRRTPSAHPASEYLLSGRLRARQDDGVLVGTLSGPAGKKTAYYRRRRSKRGRLKGSIYNNLIPAKPLRDAVAALLADVLLDAPDLRDRLTRHLHEQRTEALRDRPDVAQLEAERDELRQQISATMQCLSGAALDDAKVELKRLGDRRNVPEERLAAFRTESKQELRPVETVIEEALQVLAEDSRRLLTLPLEPLRDLVNRLIAEATFDMETKAVDLELTLPAWALLPKPKKKKRQHEKEQETALEGTDALCPATRLRSIAQWWTHPAAAIDLGSATCEYVRRQWESCFECRRIRPAA